MHEPSTPLRLFLATATTRSFYPVDGPGSPEIRRVWCVPCGLLDRQAPRRPTPISHDPALFLHFTTGRRLFSHYSIFHTRGPQNVVLTPNAVWQGSIFSPGLSQYHAPVPPSRSASRRENKGLRYILHDAFGTQPLPVLFRASNRSKINAVCYCSKSGFSGQPFVCRAYPARKSASSRPKGLSFFLL